MRISAMLVPVRDIVHPVFLVEMLAFPWRIVIVWIDRTRHILVAANATSLKRAHLDQGIIDHIPHSLPLQFAGVLLILADADDQSMATHCRVGIQSSSRSGVTGKTVLRFRTLHQLIVADDDVTGTC